MINKNRVIISFIFFSLSALIVFAFTFYSEPKRHGDGHEYALIAQAFINHLSPDIRIDDVDIRKHQLSMFPSSGYVSEIFDAIKQTIATKSEMQHGIFRAENGRYYGYHFWIYPAFVAVVEVFANALGANPFSGFQIANGMLLLLVIAYCLLILKSSLSRQLSVICAFILGGPIFYLKWTHPEFFISTLLFLGFLALYQRLFRVVFPCFALASIQVVSLWTVFATIPLLLFLKNRKGFKKEIVYLSKYWWVWVCCFLPASSLVFYYLFFGKISLIGAGHTNIDLISFSHLYSFWFDLDQGAVVGVPWLFLIILIFLFQIKKISNDCLIHFMVAAFGSLLICIPLLAQTSVNSGQSVFQRYALYAVSPLTAWAGLYFVDLVKNRIFQLVFLFTSVIYVSAFSGANAKEDHMSHKPWTKMVFEYFPNYYNPEPGVFYARSTGAVEWKIDSDRAVAFKDRNGIIRKILFPISNMEKSLSIICAGKLIDRDGLPIDLSKASHGAYGWAYLNGEMFCDGVEWHARVNLSPRYPSTLLSGIDFTRDGFPSFVEFASGLSVYERWGRWSDGPLVVFKINEKFPARFDLKILVGSYANNLGQSVNVSVNGITETFVVDSIEPKEYTVSFRLPNEVDEAVIRIMPPNPTSPMSLGLSSDNRLLGLSFINLSLDY